jgi:transcription initiation factor TFIIIB Brf1 subunit/transcription initiation factor TFIIB
MRTARLAPTGIVAVAVLKALRFYRVLMTVAEVGIMATVDTGDIARTIDTGEYVKP